MGLGLTGKLGRAWVGAWRGAWVQPGLVRLYLGVGGGLDGDSEEVVGVVSYATSHALTHAWPSLPVNPNPNPTLPNLWTLRLHDTAAITYLVSFKQ